MFSMVISNDFQNLYMLFYSLLILGEKWHKSRANIHESLIVQSNGWAQLDSNWLYWDFPISDISSIPIFSKRCQMRIPLDRQSAIPLYQQIETHLRQGILSG